MFLILFLCFIMFLTLYDTKNERGSPKWLIFADFGACKAAWGQNPDFGVNFQSCSKCLNMVSKVFTSIYWTQRKYFKALNT